MATVAVFLALTGGAIAATKIGKNSVGATQLKKNAVVTAKLKDKAVVTAKIGDGAVTAAKANLASLGIIHSGRKLLNPVDGSGLAGALTVNLFNSGGLLVEGTCQDNGAGKIVTVRATANSGARVRATHRPSSVTPSTSVPPSRARRPSSPSTTAPARIRSGSSRTSSWTAGPRSRSTSSLR